jgi:outer membrane immunogenic protein
LAPADYGSETDNSLVGGAQVGCDYQLGPSFVIGAQGQFDWGDLNGSHVLPAFPTFTMNDKTDRFATATARLGYAFAGSALAYVKGGAAWVHNTDTLIGAGPPPFLSESASWTATGWTVGGGVEYRFMSNLSIFAEYDYMDFGTQTIAFAAPTGLFPFGEHINVRQTVQEAKLGVNWRFNFGGPFATRY